jgi:hypothetical protein
MPSDYNEYPPNWSAIRQAVLTRAGNRCECTGQCGRLHVEGRCVQVYHAPSVYGTRGAPVILTTAHLCTCQPLCGDLAHLLSLCQACHLLLDLPLHVRHAARTRLAEREAAGQLRLWAE